MIIILCDLCNNKIKRDSNNPRNMLKYPLPDTDKKLTATLIFEDEEKQSMDLCNDCMHSLVKVLQQL